MDAFADHDGKQRGRAQEQLDKHSHDIEGLSDHIESVEARVSACENAHRTLRENCKELAVTHCEKSETLEQHGRRLAAAADRDDHLAADVVAARTELRERVGKVERLLRILSPEDARRRNELLEKSCLHGAGKGPDLSAGEASELRVLNEQVSTAPTGDPDSDRAMRIIREAAEGVENQIIKRLDGHDQRLADAHEERKQLREDADAARKVRQDLGECFDQLRADHDEHVAEYAKHVGPLQTLAQRAMNAASAASDGLTGLEKRVDANTKACAANKTHWENVANRTDDLKKDVGRLRTEVGGASGRAETAMEMAKEARRIALNPDGDAGVPALPADKLTVEAPHDPRKPVWPTQEGDTD